MTGVKALVYLADPSALSVQWTAITGGAYSGGSASNGVTVPVGGQSLVGPFTFTAPTAGLGDGHKCLIAAIQATGEPAPSNNFDAPSSHQVAQRNLQLSNCAYPLTNATTTNGQVTLKLTVSPSASKASLTGTPDVEVTFDDPDSSWFSVWHDDPAINQAYRLTHAGTTTTLRLGRNGVTLRAVPLAAGASRNAKAVINLATGDQKTTLALQATLNDGTRDVVTNGGSCQALPPPVTQ
ncbi:MAG: hypothetical protein JWN04_3233 [Myxococcaceae bacterium]|nr:hypothetical protein [Myxococcaceae bacterium]